MALKMQATTLVEVPQTVGLKPALRTEVRSLMGELVDLNIQAAGIEKRKAVAKERIEVIFADSGEYDALVAGTTIDGLKAQLIQPHRGSLDEKLLLKLLTPAQLASCRVKTATTPYVKVSKETA